MLGQMGHVRNKSDKLRQGRGAEKNGAVCMIWGDLVFPSPYAGMVLGGEGIQEQ